MAGPGGITPPLALECKKKPPITVVFLFIDANISAID